MKMVILFFKLLFIVFLEFFLRNKEVGKRFYVFDYEVIFYGRKYRILELGENVKGV